MEPGQYYIGIHCSSEVWFSITVTTGTWRNGRPYDNLGIWSSPNGHVYNGEYTEGRFETRFEGPNCEVTYANGDGTYHVPPPH
jgi:hypothetical protein